MPAEAALTPAERTRYSRHLLLPTVGVAGQQRLKAASVLLVGAGGLGSPMALYLAAAGVGRIGLVDFDVVEATNLHRQLLHGTDDVGRSKLASAADRLRSINPHLHLDLHETRLDRTNALAILGGYDVVADGADNFPTRYLVNDACVLLGTPNVHGSVFRFEGQVSVFGLPGGPCYRCLYPTPPPPGLVPSCAEGGVLGVLPGTIGTLQATEVLKLLLGVGEPLAGRLLLYDALRMEVRTMRFPRHPACPACGDAPTITELIDYEAFCNAPPLHFKPEPMSAVPELSVHDLKARMDADDAPFLLDVRRPNEYDICNLGGTLIPLDELPNRLDELEPYRDQTFVVHCRSGGRSAQAVQFLRQSGFDGAVNLAGGVLAWSDQIDPSMPKY